MKILIVDDDEHTAAMINLIVERLGHNTRVAHNLADANGFDEDVILMDGLLPDGSGIEVGRALVEGGKKVVFISGASDDHNLRLMWKVAHVITKPIGAHTEAQLQRILGVL